MPASTLSFVMSFHWREQRSAHPKQEWIAEAFHQLKRKSQKKIFRKILHPNAPVGPEADSVWKNTDVNNSELKTILKYKILNV